MILRAESGQMAITSLLVLDSSATYRNIHVTTGLHMVCLSLALALFIRQTGCEQKEQRNRKQTTEKGVWGLDLFARLDDDVRVMIIVWWRQQEKGNSEKGNCETGE